MKWRGNLLVVLHTSLKDCSKIVIRIKTRYWWEMSKGNHAVRADE